MLEEACAAVEVAVEQERRLAETKYWRRNTMRYIDQLLNELELLNLENRIQVPQPIAAAVGRLIEECQLAMLAKQPRATIIETMDVLFEIQDSLMFHQIEDE